MPVGSAMWLCKGIKYSVISTRISDYKASRSNRQVGRSAGRQVGKSALI